MTSSEQRGTFLCILINWAVDVLLVELHLTGYRFCGSVTKLWKRLASGNNESDEACREHVIAYAIYKDNNPNMQAPPNMCKPAWKLWIEVLMKQRTRQQWKRLRQRREWIFELNDCTCVWMCFNNSFNSLNVKDVSSCVCVCLGVIILWGSSRK